MSDQDYQNTEQDRRIKWLEDHYTTWNREFGDIKTDVALIKKDMQWLKRMIWWLIGIVLGGLGFISAILIQHLTSTSK